MDQIKSCFIVTLVWQGWELPRTSSREIALKMNTTSFKFICYLLLFCPIMPHYSMKIFQVSPIYSLPPSECTWAVSHSYSACLRCSRLGGTYYTEILAFSWRTLENTACGKLSSCRSRCQNKVRVQKVYWGFIPVKEKNLKQDLQWEPSDHDTHWRKPLPAQWRTPEQRLPIMGVRGESCIG